MDCSAQGFPIHHQLSEIAQTHVHRLGDAIQPPHPLSTLSVFNLTQHQGIFFLPWPLHPQDYVTIMPFFWNLFSHSFFPHHSLFSLSSSNSPIRYVIPFVVVPHFLTMLSFYLLFASYFLMFLIRYPQVQRVFLSCVQSADNPFIDIVFFSVMLLCISSIYF